MEINRPAGFWVRFGASIIDGILLSIVGGFFSYSIYGAFSTENSIASIIDLLYVIILPIVWYGYTVGKRVLGIRIVKLNGEPPTIGTMLLRVIVSAIVYAITIGIGLIVSAFMVGLREDRRAIHDLIAGTYVTYEPPYEGERNPI